MAEPARPLEQSSPVTQTLRLLKKGQLLFKEGESSRAMYFIKKGMIRVYKQKGASVIEINTAHAGEVLGELAFLDGNPRSASGEALMDCELVEISGEAFQRTLDKMPDWLKLLLKTIVTRLRTASTRIRQLETASLNYENSKTDGKRSAHYIYLPHTDVTKICTSILLVASRYGEELKMPLVQRYANQIMNVPVAKISSMVDVLCETGILEFADKKNSNEVLLKEAEFLEQLITYLNDENLLDPSKRHDLSPRDYFIMGMINRYLVKYPRDPSNGCRTVNLAEIKSIETAMTGKQPFRLEEVQRLVQLGYMEQFKIISANEVYSQIHGEYFSKSFRLQRIVMAIHILNDRKRATHSK